MKAYLLRSIIAVVLVVVFLSSCSQADPGFILLGMHVGQVGSSYYTLQPDGTNLRLIHHIPQENLMPVLSPDGQKILFFSGPDANGQGELLTVMNIDGTDPITLTTGSGHSSPPAWSPDGQQIAYIGTDLTIHAIHRDGSGDINLTQALSSRPTTYYLSPIWSPDGQKIAFLGWPGNQYDIYVVNADGTDPLNITSLAVDYLPDPVWSPDGQQLAYIDVSKAAIYLIGADGTQPEQLTAAPAGYRPTSVAWSPDGQRLAINAWSLEVTKPHSRLFSINRDGTNLIPLYDDDIRGGTAFAWSPDGQQLAFAAGGPFFNNNLYIVNVDGSNLTQLTLKDVSNIERVQWGKSTKTD